MEILTWAQRKTIIQTQFVSVVSKVISGGIFNQCYFSYGFSVSVSVTVVIFQLQLQLLFFFSFYFYFG